MKILISLIICATVTAEPGILDNFIKFIRGPDVEKSEYEKYPTENGLTNRSELGTQSDEQNNTQKYKKTSQSPSLTSQLFKYVLDGVDTLVDRMNTGIASEQNFSENEEQEIDYTHLGIPQKIYWYYANKGVVPILSSGACSCPFQLQLYQGVGTGYNQKIPFNGDVRYLNSEGSAKGNFLDPLGGFSENPSRQPEKDSNFEERGGLKMDIPMTNSYSNFIIPNT